LFFFAGPFAKGGTLPRVVPTGDDEASADAPAAVGTSIPVEMGGGVGSWAGRCAATLLRVLLRPRDTFTQCPEPVNHGRALRYLATLRLPPWVLLVTWLLVQYLRQTEPEPIPTRSIHAFVEPPLAEAVSAWLVLMVPVGMPLLYFLGGLMAHIGMALTGGASRSIGASMRAVGYALGPALLAIGLFDLPLYTVGLPAEIYFALAAVVAVVFLYASGFALARTHQTHPARGFLVSLLPATLLIGAMLGRAVLVLDVVPGLPEPESPYFVP
jgi:hypothetical protein